MEPRPTTAFVLSLVAGLWMLATGGMMFGMGPRFAGQASWMWGHGMMHGMMRVIGPDLWFQWIGAVGGGVVIVGSMLLYNQPEQSRTWGLLILIVSAVNFLVGMGGLAAGTLGIVGGALAMSWRPPAS